MPLLVYRSLLWNTVLILRRGSCLGMNAASPRKAVMHALILDHV